MNNHQRASDKLSLVFMALSHPIRREILSTLADGDASVKKLAEPYNLSMVAITKHLKILERAGLISKTKIAQLRISHLQAGPLKVASDWVQKYKEFWTDSFDKLDEYIEELKRSN
jgi:DNA-binding transcriptional ArsR family regulator